MHKRTLIVFLSFYAFTLIGQEDAPYPLHPSIGDTIDLEEKLDYSLFPVVPNNAFAYATIHYKKESFVLYINEGISVDPMSGLEVETTIELPITQEEIIESQKNIEKVNAYYRYLATDSTEKKAESDILKNNKGIPMKLENNEKMSEQLKKQFRMDQRLKEDAQRMREVEMGLRPREVRLEFR